MSTSRSLTARLILRSLIAVIFVAALLFLPAGSLRFWQGWVFMAILFFPMPVTSVYFLKRDPQLVERRLRTKEKTSEQQTIIRGAQWIAFVSLVIPGFDYRFGWSRVPLWLTILSQLFVFTGYLITLWVMKENSFASRTVQIEEGQRVISTGPYGLVRHPMYFRAVCVPVPSGKPLRNWFQRAGCRIRGLSVWEFDFSFFCLVTKPLLVVRRRRGQTLPVYFPALHGNAPASAIDAM